jgi:hypothetical protein
MKKKKPSARTLARRLRVAETDAKKAQDEAAELSSDVRRALRIHRYAFDLDFALHRALKDDAPLDIQSARELSQLLVGEVEFLRRKYGAAP